ncbi:hypothetical protein OEZ85_010845 [Tetradesmus obliquus]|uniref:Uncharacterized protein n=1 Tax=Tetradesmus obliquus TaxID=3088 RepID=A0ABY8TNR1_TETOB|nr:hypothetical protein OEZ85_010845 [Tetradesmus obliquus]
MLLQKQYSAARVGAQRISESRAPACSRQQPWTFRHSIVLRAAPEDGPMGEDMSDILKQDMERFARQQPASTAAKQAAQQKQEASSSPLKEAVDKVLIADFFFVLAVLGWLGAGLAGKAMGSSALIDAWMPLWPMVFQPAIGILMAGALVSGGLNWLAEQQQQKS